MKKNYVNYLVVIYLLILKINGFAQTDTVFFDDFKDNKNEWSVTVDDKTQMVIKNGFYSWSGKDIMIDLKSIFFNKDSSFSIEVKFESYNSGQYGIIWGANGNLDASLFVLKENKFRIFDFVDKEVKEITEFTESDKINENINTLRIEMDQKLVRHFINDEKVYEGQHEKMFGRSFGFAFWGGGKIQINSILIKGKKQSINLIPDNIYSTQPENLGKRINSKYSELMPVISPDEKTLFLIRGGDPNNTGGKDNQDIYYSKNENNKWSEAKNIGKPLNNEASNGVLSVTPDGNTLLLFGKYDEKGDNTGKGLSFSHRTNDGWSMPESLQITNYYNKNKYTSVCMSNDGKTILLSLERDDTFGEKDIYVSFLQTDGSWSEPLNLGNDINTEYGDGTPFLASDGVSLYYSTEGLPGYGSTDIFVTKRLDDSWTKWSEPQNIGKPVNTSGWDAYYSIAASGEYAYFVSANNSLGNEDIFRIKLPEKAKPNPVVLISGKVLNSKTNKPLDGTISYETLPDGKEAGIARTNPSNGEYKIVLPYGKKYGFSAKANDFISVSDNIDLTNIAEYKEINRDLFLVPIEVGEIVRLNNIFFDFAKATLRDESIPELDRVVAILINNPSMEIQMAGHTDNVGSDDANLQLSRERAKAVKEYIVSKGIKESRIISKGFGKTKPVSTNETEEGKQLNRRVEFTILKK